MFLSLQPHMTSTLFQDSLPRRPVGTHDRLWPEGDIAVVHRHGGVVLGPAQMSHQTIFVVRKIPATQSLSELGYQPLHDRVYRATWSTPDVEHFIYLTGGSQGVSAAFGVRNQCADRFARREIIKYGGDTIARALEHEYDERSSCTMRFSFSLFDPFWSRPIRSLFDPILGPKMHRMVTERIFPAVKDVVTIDKLLCLLLADKRPCHWVATNGAIRAAQIVVLADKCGVPSAQTRATLEARQQWIANGFLKSSPMRNNPAEYVNRVLEDWDASPRSEV